MAIVSDIEIRLRADIARLQQDLNQARQSVDNTMSRIGSAVKGAAGALAALGLGLSVNAFAQWIKGAIDATDVVSDLSQKTGIAIKDIAGLQLWFQKGGTEAGAFESSMVKLSRKIADGGTEFTKLGIKTRDANGGLRSNVDVLLDSADAFAAMQDGTAKTAIAVELFGKTGAELIPLLNEGSAGLREMNEMAEKLGLTFDQETVDAAGNFNDTLDFLAGAAQGVARQVAAQLLPTLNSLAGSFLTLITEGDGVRKAADVIGTGFKILYTIGVGVVEIFNTVGKTIGAAAAQLVAILTGEFKMAAQIGREWSADMAQGWTASAKSVADVWTGAGGEVVAAMVKTQHAGKITSDEAAKAAKKQADAYQNLLSSIREKVAETGAEAAGMKALNDAQKMTIKLDEDLRSGKVTLTAAQESNVRAQIAAYASNLDLLESQKDFKKMAEELAKADAARVAEAEKVIDAARKEAETQENLVLTFGMTKSAIAAVEVARLEEQLAQKESNNLTHEEIKNLEALIFVKKRSAEASASLESLEATKKATEDQARLWESIDKTAHDTFVSIVDGGKSAATRLKDTFKNVFFDWLYQQTLKKWIINLQGTTSIGDGLSALSGGGSGGSGILGSASNLISIGKTIYSGFTAGIASTLGTTITSLGTTFGSAAVAEFGAGMSGAAGTGLASGTAAGAGASAAAAIPVIGWIIAGMASANKLYKEGWDFNNGSVNTIGKVLGSGINLVDKLARSLGLSNSTANIISGLAPVSKLFGRKNPELESQGVDLTVGSQGIYGNDIATILEKGGIFRSDKRTYLSSALSDSFLDVIKNTFSQMSDATKSFAGTVGAGTDLSGFSKDFKITWDKDVAKREQQMTDLMASLGNDMATYLVPNIADFATAGEMASVTLQRLATEFAQTDAVLNALGVDGAQAFGAVGLASIEARERLLALAGGVDALAAQTDYFTKNFLTAEQQMEPTIKAVNEQLAALGYAGLTTTEQFRDAVQGLASSGALATEQGAKTYTGLLALAPAFKTVADYMAQVQQAAEDLAASEAAAALEAAARAAEEAAAAAAAAAEQAANQAAERRQLEIELMDITGDAAGALAARREDELAALYPMNRALQEMIYARQDEAKATAAAEEASRAAAAEAAAAAQALADANAAQKQGMYDLVNASLSAVERAVNQQKNVVTAAYEKSMTELSGFIDDMNGSIDKTRTLSESLKAAINGASVPGSESTGRASAQAQIAQALAVAKATGVLPDAADLRDALSAVSRDATDQFSSYADYVRDSARTLGNLAGLGEITDSQLTIQEQQLAELVTQRDTAKMAYEMQIAYLDNQLLLAQQQVDALNGVNNSVLSVVAAVAGLQGALAGAYAPPTTSSAGVTTGLSVEELYRSALGREGDAAGLAFWKKAYGAVVDSGELQDFMKAAAPELAAKAAGNWQQYLGQNEVGSAQRSGTMATDGSAMLTVLETISDRIDKVSAASRQTADLLDSVTAGGNAMLTES